jgi:hypothetical protein
VISYSLRLLPACLTTCDKAKREKTRCRTIDSSLTGQPCPPSIHPLVVADLLPPKNKFYLLQRMCVLSYLYDAGAVGLSHWEAPVLPLT